MYEGSICTCVCMYVVHMSVYMVHMYRCVHVWAYVHIYAYIYVCVHMYLVFVNMGAFLGVGGTHVHVHPCV